MKIALVHDYIKEYGGAEKVLEELAQIFPDAPIYTTLYRPQFLGPHQKRLEKLWQGRIHQSFFNYIPFAHKIISPLRLLSPLAFRLFDFSQYDLIISSATGAYFPNSLDKKSAKLICYCHTPPRYLYGLATARNLTKYPLLNFAAQFANHFLRLLDFKYAQNVDQFIANSSTTAKRIQKYYRRPSLVINPPVDLPTVSSPKSKGEAAKPRGISYYLTGGRLARAKRYDIAIHACNHLKLPLKVFGRDFAGFESELRSISGPTIDFLGEVDQQQKAQLFQSAKAFIFCSDNEDFGIVPVEAMAYACPVIAYKSGGVTETVLEGKTGVFFDQLTQESCSQAIKKFESLKIKPQDCLARAQEFSTQKFHQKIKDLIKTL